MRVLHPGAPGQPAGQTAAAPGLSSCRSRLSPRSSLRPRPQPSATAAPWPELMLGGAAVLAVHQVVRSRSLESVAYPVVGLALGLVFTTGLVIQPDPAAPAAAAAPAATSPALEPQARRAERASQTALPDPTRTAICAVQAALSLTLVWSNTAYVDEADYLWAGRLEIAHWLHGTSWPSAYAYQHSSPGRLSSTHLSALSRRHADGLARARILSLAFMLIGDSPALSHSVKADRPHRGALRR